MEVDAAAAKNDGEKRSAALSPAGAVAMAALSLLFGWLTDRALRPSGAGDDPAATLFGVVWRTSPLVCAYLFCWTVALSPPAPMDAAALFARVSYLLLLAVAGASLLGPLAAAAAMLLATVYSAAAAGRALAERRQRAGAERSSAAAAARATPRYRSRTFMAAVLAAVMSLDMWTDVHLEPGAAAEATPGMLAAAACPVLLAARLALLRAGPRDGGGERRGVAVALAPVYWVMFMACISCLPGGGGVRRVTAVAWAVAMGTAGCVGYSLAVDARYELLMTIKRSQPRRAQDASGLLVGRDEEDACPAHI
ncbi:hypothetical protein ACP4OV_014641 [Aristida adscensionis]